MRSTQALIGLLLTLSAVGCGDDDEGSGIPDNQNVGSLSSDQLGQLCQEVDRKFDRFERAFVSVLCTTTGQLAGDACTATRDQCIKDTPTEGSLSGMVEFTCSGSPTAITMQCPDVTVGELEGCLEEIVSSIEAAAAQFTCTASTFMPTDTPKACSDLEARCMSLSDFSLAR